MHGLPYKPIITLDLFNPSVCDGGANIGTAAFNTKLDDDYQILTKTH